MNVDVPAAALPVKHLGADRAVYQLDQVQRAEVDLSAAGLSGLCGDRTVLQYELVPGVDRDIARIADAGAALAAGRSLGPRRQLTDRSDPERPGRRQSAGEWPSGV